MQESKDSSLISILLYLYEHPILSRSWLRVSSSCRLYTCCPDHRWPQGFQKEHMHMSSPMRTWGEQHWPAGRGKYYNISLKVFWLKVKVCNFHTIKCNCIIITVFKDVYQVLLLKKMNSIKNWQHHIDPVGVDLCVKCHDS